MDILKIRKKAQEAKAHAEEASTLSTRPKPEAPAPLEPSTPAPPAVEEPPATDPLATAYAGMSLPSTPRAPESPAPASAPVAREPVAPAPPRGHGVDEVLAVPTVTGDIAASSGVSAAPLPDGPIERDETDELVEKFARTRREMRAHDPLGDFLAYYDAEVVEDDLDDKPTFISEASSRRFLAFNLAHEAYAVLILDVREILKTYAVTQVPRAPRSVLGVLSKRGVVMPVIDLAAALGLRESDTAMKGDQRILVVGEGDEVVGLRVDRVQAVVQIPSAKVEPVPGGLGPRSAHLLSGLGRVGEQLYILLDVGAFLGHLHGTIDPEAIAAGAA